MIGNTNENVNLEDKITCRGGCEGGLGSHDQAGLLVRGPLEGGEGLHLVVVGVVPPLLVAPHWAGLAVKAALSSTSSNVESSNSNTVTQ